MWGNSYLSLEESEEEVTEIIKNLSNKIEEHRSLEKIVQTKEVLVGESNKEKEELKKNNKAQVLNIAKSMLQFGMPIEQIAQATGLSRKEIEQI